MWSYDFFNDQMFYELIDLTSNTPANNEEEMFQKIYELCNRHGLQIIKALKRIQNLFDDPLKKLPDGSILDIINKRDYLREPVERFIERIIENLKNSIPLAFKKNLPKDENDLNDKINAFMHEAKNEYSREHPNIKFGLTKVVPDHSYKDYDLLIETKYLRGKVSLATITDGIASDIIKYPEKSYILFIIYDPERKIYDDENFKFDFEQKNLIYVK